MRRKAYATYAEFMSKGLDSYLSSLFPVSGPQKQWRIEYVNHSVSPSGGRDFFGGILRIVVKTKVPKGEPLEEELTVGRVPLTNEKGRFVLGDEERPIETARAVAILKKGVMQFVRGLEEAGESLRKPPAAWSREIPSELSTDLCREILREMKATELVPVLTPVTLRVKRL
ncbi:MAG: hypothetical protein JNK82_15755 [Myxococcaceae bacterium]|nr:hypothetical protein [Myxococcaceae bacterium]